MSIHSEDRAPAPEATREADAAQFVRATRDALRAMGFTEAEVERATAPVEGFVAAERDAEIDQLRATIAAQARENETLRADKARLDWLEREHPRVGLGEDGVTRLFARDCYGDMLAEAPTFREAIDAALAARAPEPEP